MHANGFLRNVFYSYQNLGEALDVFTPNKFSKDIFNTKICYRYNL